MSEDQIHKRFTASAFGVRVLGFRVLRFRVLGLMAFSNP